MSSKVPKPHINRRTISATVAALAVIVWGALFLIAPVWQFPDAVAAYIPPSIAPTEDDLSQAARLNINTASAQELQTLPGIGPARAAAIIAYREEHGPFESLAQLDCVSGITPRMVNAWSDLATAIVPEASQSDHK